MTTKEKYRRLVQTQEMVIFLEPWWLDIVCGKENWDVVIIEEAGALVAAFPYCMRRKYGFTWLFQPPLTPRLGPWLSPSEGKYASQFSRQKKKMALLVEQLPDFDYFCQNFNHQVTNWLPFYWKGFHQTTYYTYLFDDLSNINKIWNGFQNTVRTDIRKAQKKTIVKSDLDIDSFIDIYEFTFRRQNLSLPYTRDFIRTLDNACDKYGRRKIFYAQDEKKRIHAAIYLVWDKTSAYYLMGGGNPELRKSGATSLLIWEAIKFSSQVTRNFDFEGSMIEPIERFFRSFGAKQVPYFHISSMNRRTKLLFSIRALLRDSWSLL